MDEEFYSDIADTESDMSSDAETSDIDADVADYETLDDISDISDDIPNVDAEDKDYNTLDDVSDNDIAESEYDALDAISEDTLDTVSDDALETDCDEDPYVEYESLDDIPDTEDDTGVDELEIETLEDIPEELIENDSTDAEFLDDMEILDDEVGEDDFSESDLAENPMDDSDVPNDLDATIDQIMNSDLSPEHKKDLLQNIRDEIAQGEVTSSEDDVDAGFDAEEIYPEDQFEETGDMTEEDSPKVLKRELTDEELAARDRDMEEVLDNYRENLRDYGVDEDVIEDFINQQRDKINAEYESLDNGDSSSNIYYEPTDWEEIANELKSPQTVSDETGTEQITEARDLNDISGWLGDINPNFDEFDPESPYCNNCGSCAFAVYNRLNGDTDMCASAENIGYNDEMNALTGMEQVSMSPEEIESRLLSEGNGAHAIIGIDRAEGPGHWFNAACIDGKVVAIDGQTGEILDWPPDYGDVVNWEMSVKKGDR